MANERLRAGVIGVGRMGQFHSNIYSELPEVELVGVSDLDEERGSEVAKRFGIEYFPDYRDLLKVVDVVSIAVPTKLHYEVGKTALEAGCHALVEKPISNNFEHAKELFSIAGDKGLVLHVGHIERFNGAVQELQKLIEDPILIQSRRLGPFEKRVAEDGVVLDLMIHDIDIILNLVNSEVVNLNVIGSSVFSDRDDVVVVQILFESGCMATITASRATQFKVRNMAITCRSKYMKLDFSDQEIMVHRLATSEHELRNKELKYTEEDRRERIFVHRENPLKLELQHMVDCILNKADRRVSVDNELKSLRVALQILEKFKQQAKPSNG